MWEMAQKIDQVVSNSSPNPSSAAAKRNEKPKRRLKLSEGQHGKPQKEPHLQVTEVDIMAEEEGVDSAEALAT